MRVADRTTNRNYLKYLNKAKSDYAKTNERVASGNKFEAVSDDVSGASRVLSAKSSRYRVEQQYENVKDINDELATAETAMTSMVKIFSDIRTRVSKALNDPTAESGRASLIQEMQSMQDEILQYANTQYGSRYVFGGTNAASAPFSFDKDSGEFRYNGINVDIIQKNAEGNYFYTGKDGEEVSIPMDGDVYMDVGLGIKMTGPNVDPNTAFKISYSGLDFLGFGVDEKSGVSNNLFSCIGALIQGVKDYDAKDKTEARKALETASTHFTKLTDDFRGNLTSIGSKTNHLDSMQDRLKNTVDSLTMKIFNTMGTNDAEEASNQTMNDYVLKAVIQMGARILPVSLMDYLR